MDIKYFKLIKTIAEEGNLANSSHKLFLTQSALSHQLKELELRLGFKVFIRSRNKWELTEEGNELYKTSCEVLSSIDKGFKNIQQLQEGSNGTIKVSTECYSFYQGLPSFIQKMGILYPNITVELILEDTHQPIPKLLSKDIDIAIVTEKPNQASLENTAIFEDEIFAILHKEHPLAKRDHLNADDFASIDLIIHSFPLETVSVYQQFLKPNQILPKKITAIPLTEVALEIVKANMGITCMPKWALQTFKLSDDLVFKQIGPQGVTRTHYVVIRKTDASKKYIQEFVANYTEEFRIKTFN
ncbi:LysR family transcriptional regulator [Tenacibaculum agarivorans]|uniref:LysR family transcriptional regulator n=1 Tax=Tenacibaculum agarivorans TaxID=1908389 RepID=UPI00094B8F5B|nr:LysR family transcriptional regulator [Tenacibaculum agarivorans]